MWLRVVALLLYMLPGLVLAQGTETATLRPEGPVAGALDPRRPAEPPPPDFTGRQYIDSGGCVFLRTDAGWRARLSRDGGAICGWPPTFTARGADAPPLPGAEPRAAQIERLLTETIITNLHEGELIAGAGETLPPVRGAGDGAANEAPPAARADADPLGIGRMIATAPELRRQLVGPARAEHMCQLIGAGDPLGLCGPAENQLLALTPRAPSAAAGPKLVTAAPDIPPTPSATAATAPQAALGATTPSAAAVTAPQAALVATTPPAAAAAAAQAVPVVTTPLAAAATAPRVAPPAMTPPVAATAGAAQALPATTSPQPPATSPRTASPPATSLASSPATASRTAPGPTEARSEVPLLIPPGARYLEVGAFKDPLDAHVLAQKLVAMGLPVVRSKPGQTTLSAVMVGPLEGREAMVRMADRLRKAGFARLVAR